MSKPSLAKWKWAGGVAASLLLTWTGWAAHGTFIVGPLNARIDRTDQAVKTAQDAIDKRAPLVDRFLIVEDGVKRIEEQGREMAREIKELRSGQARIEGLLDGMRKDKIAMEKRP